MRILPALVAVLLSGCETSPSMKGVGLEAAAQRGILLKHGGHVLFGSAAVTTSPASIDFQRIRQVTPEWREIRSERVRSGSGRWDLLIVAMNRRIRDAVVAAAERRGYDCVFRAGDLKRSNGLRIFDLTQEVLERLR